MTLFKEKLASGNPVSGPIVSEIRSVGPIKALANAGHDFVWVDMEHAMFNWETTQTLVQYSRLVGITPLVRVTDLSYTMVARALDSGAIGVVIPRVDTADQIRDAVSYARYPPLGRRGAGGEGRYGFERRLPADAVEEVNAATVVVVQVETVEAVERIDEFAAVEGL